jgi:hypothetical protein
MTAEEEASRSAPDGDLASWLRVEVDPNAAVMTSPDGVGAYLFAPNTTVATAFHIGHPALATGPFTFNVSSEIVVHATFRTVEDVREEVLRIAEREAARDSSGSAGLVRLTGTTASQLRRLRESSGLFAFKYERSWRYPNWQFTEDMQPIPGLPIVVPMIPSDMHPYELQRIFTTAHPSLVVDGKSVSPRRWLLSGHPVSGVLPLLFQEDSAPRS